MIEPTSKVFSVTEIERKCTAIIRFGPSGLATDGLRPAEYYQVTIDPAKISPSGEYIRFGETAGDEIMGWQRAAALSVVEILGEWNEDGTPPLFNYGAQGKVTMLIAGDQK